MTGTGDVRARFEITDWDGKSAWAEYRDFKVNSESSKYKLTFGGHSGNLCDSLGHHNGKNFSSFDHDNDEKSDVNCAADYNGGWWHGSCCTGNFNGKYFSKHLISLPYMESRPEAPVVRAAWLLVGILTYKVRKIVFSGFENLFINRMIFL